MIPPLTRKLRLRLSPKGPPKGRGAEASGWLIAVALVCIAVGCGGNSDGDGDLDPGKVAVGLDLVASGFEFPLLVVTPPGDRERLFVVEKGGRVRIVRNGAIVEPPFLDLRGEVSGGNEQGLLGLAFHPGYDGNGRFFVNFTDRAGDTRVVEYRRSANPDQADASTARLLLFVDQPFANHNGGGLAFGPDGFLYIGLGDGGGGSDPSNNGQSLETLLAKILRIDVDGGAPYGIPGSNPFTGTAGARGEIWAFGLRNPWRFAFDRATRDLYIGDVGQSEREEIDFAPASSGGGENYGWDVIEGSTCLGANECDRNGLVLPVVEYDHDEGCSVTGGFVYRGSAVPELRGRYFYGDFCEGFVRSFRISEGRAVEQLRWPQLAPGGLITSFGEDDAGELYVAVSSGSIFRIAPVAR